MLNQCTYIGRLVRKPELRHVSGGKPFTAFTIAVDRDLPDKDGNWVSDFIDCVAWEKMAEKICAKYDKGDLLAVSGRTRNRPPREGDGQSRSLSNEVVVTVCYRMNPKKDNLFPQSASEVLGNAPEDGQEAE